MADFVATAGFDDVELIETTELILGRDPLESVALGSAKPANKQAQALLNNIQALRDGKPSGARNSVLYGASTGGVATFGTFSAKVLTIAGNVKPLVLNFAQSVSAFGLKETVVSYTGTTTIDYSASTSGKQYLVFAVLTGSTLSFVSLEVTSDIVYHVGPTVASLIGSDQFYYNTIEQACYREVGGAWVLANAILIGGVSILVGGSFAMKPYGTPAHSYDAPCGSICAWHAATAAPEGWALCDGSTKNFVTAIELYNTIGTTYGGTALNFVLPTISNSIIKLF